MPRLLAPLLLVLALLAVLSPPASAAPASRDEALAAWLSVRDDILTPAGWTGAVETCTVGQESPASLASTLQTVNILRDFAGIGPVTFDDELNRRALAAALMMAAANDLSHSPGPDWPCYSDDGARAAGESNLFLGESGASAMVGYADDSGVDSLGHRRWLLDPAATVFGSGSTGRSNALTVFGPRTPVPADTTVAWPAAGWMPRDWVPPVWSLAVGGDNQQVAFQNPQVTVTLDGRPVTVESVQDLGSDFGSGRTLSWRPAFGSGLAEGDHVVDVTIAGVVVDGRSLPVTYEVNVFEPPTEVRFLSRPTIARRGSRRGAIRPGTVLAARANVTLGATRAYQWLRGGRPIAGATKRAYRVRRADRGRRVSCRVTASIPGIGHATRTTRGVRVRR